MAMSALNGNNTWNIQGHHYEGDEYNTHLDTHHTSFNLGRHFGKSSDLWVAYDGNGRVGKGDAHMYFYLLSFDRSGR